MHSDILMFEHLQKEKMTYMVLLYTKQWKKG